MLETPRRREIEDAASALFRQRGYAATSIRDIANVLDIRGPSLYAHVTSKQDVLWAIVDRAATRFEQAASAAMATTTHPSDRMAALVRGHVAVIAADPGDASVFVAEWRHLTGSRRDEILARRDAYEGRFRAVIDEGITDGSFTLTDPAVAAAFVLSALNGIAAWYSQTGRLTADRIADHHVELVLHSLCEAHR
jgi:AcrR family transcriptional regulator